MILDNLYKYYVNYHIVLNEINKFNLFVYLHAYALKAL